MGGMGWLGVEEIGGEVDTYDCMSGANYDAVWFKSEPQIGRGAKRHSGGIREEAQVCELFSAQRKICPFAPLCSHISAVCMCVCVHARACAA